MIRVFIDSDIILDILLQRLPHFDASSTLFKLCGAKRINGYSSVHAILNVHYVAKRIYGEEAIREALLGIVSILDLVTEDGTMVTKALMSEFADFEDAVQYQAALNAGANYIITRNLKDYKHSAIPVMTAEQFLRTIYKA